MDRRSRQLSLAPQVVEGVLVGGKDVPRIEPELPGQGAQEERALRFGRAVVFRFFRKKLRVFPYRLAVLAPGAGQRPARQRLARIPLALAKVKQASFRILFF